MKFTQSIKHIIWDWNGTLINDVLLCVNVINHILRENNLTEVTQDEYRSKFEFPVINYYIELGFDFDRTSFEKLSDQFIEYYEKQRHTLRLHKHAKKAFEFFKEKQISQCMLSATKHSLLVDHLKDHNVFHYFKTILGLDHHYADGKVHLGNEWLKINKIKKKEVLFIGDTDHDLDVAKAMGIHCILLSHGHHSHQRLSEIHPHVLNNIEELLQLF